MSLSFCAIYCTLSNYGIIFIGLSDCISQRRSSSAILLTGMELKAWFIIRISYRWKSQDQRRCGPDRTAVTVLSAIRHRRIRPARASLNPSFSGRMWRSFQPGLKYALLFSFIHTQQTTRDRCARKRALTLEMHIRCIRLL